VDINYASNAACHLVNANHYRAAETARRDQDRYQLLPAVRDCRESQGRDG
jgi:hypothetical protein